MPLIFQGSSTLAYRDPTCILADGVYHLFFTVSKKENGYMYNFVAHSESRDLLHFTEPRILTEQDNTKNFCSPGNVIRVDGEYWICVTSYPLPRRFSASLSRTALTLPKNLKLFSLFLSIFTVLF
jgi:sucrose-6-phosphate hydrolase SacC (GH32 family)